MSTITVTNLGKAYKQYPTRWSRLAEWLIPLSKPRHSLKWVMQDVSFTVKPGEAVGIIGINGAGKSTLLKMITGTTQPTTGSVHINGRVAALLELGMGFHPDFTGRQNAFMAGQLAGLDQQQIESILPDIERFADVGEYFDQPVRVYSSGMQARVAFAVATSTTPDVLIVDEALSVGDIGFQAKCMLRMQSLLDQGTTVLFVSHALNQVRQFCSRALYLEHGSVRAWGAADEVCDLYQNDLTGTARLQKSPHSYAAETPPVSPNEYDRERDPNLRKNSVDGAPGGTLRLEYLNFKILDKWNSCVTSCRLGETLKFQASILANTDIPAGANVGLLFADKSGYHLMACNTNYYDKFLPAMGVGEVAFVEWEIDIPFALGEFRIDSGIKPEPFAQDFYDRVFCIATLTVVPEVSLLKRNFGGYFFAKAKINITISQ
jgi:lipopolysaccharide transport system ATP-binding protein